MDSSERTKDIYEEIASYPKPPLVPLPKTSDLDPLQDLGIKPGRVSRCIVKSVVFAVGLGGFQKQLPHKIEDLLRHYNLRLPGLFAPVLSATIVLEDDPRAVSPIERAASLLFAARNLYDDVTSGNLAPDRLKDQVLEMGQYANLFSTSLILDGKTARIFKSTDVSHIAVAVARRFYSLRIGGLSSETTVEQLQGALCDLVDRAQRSRLKHNEPQPGILTSGANETQTKAFYELQKTKVNAESLSALRHSFLTLCLDLESHPRSYAEAAHIAHIGNCGNRWFHSSLQLVVFGNAKACVICNFTSYLDGNTMMRAAAEMQKRAVKCRLWEVASTEFVSLPPAKELKWNIRKDLVQQAQSDLRSVQDNQQAIFEIDIIGRKFLTAHNLEPVPAFIVALQMAARRLTGDTPKITQFLSMAKYRCTDLTTAMVTTSEVVRFVDHMDLGDVQADQAMALLRDAIASQERECRKARAHLPFDDIIALFLASRKGIQRSYVMTVFMIAMMLLRALGLIELGRREVLVSHPEIYPEVALVGRPGVRLPYVKNFGLHYQIFEDRIIVIVMPSVAWNIPNAELIAELRESLQRIQTIVLESSEVRRFVVM